MIETAKSHSTPAFNRRTAILGGAAIASVAAVPAAAAVSTWSPDAALASVAAMPVTARDGTPSADLIEARRLTARLRETDRLQAAADDADDKRGRRAAERKYRIAMAEYEAFADRIHAQPVRSWDDVLVRAELAGYWFDDDFSNDSYLLSRGCYDTRSAAHVVAAVLGLARGFAAS